ncbi:MAG: hypothetical protein RIM23_02160 [Coleofasciculus sp. G3-WIS-01]|uniref:hypothetical protein n=1 Tax=Coleofasciculus sp. G3-WIS-01 TaxID=3069528 RepID=UPI0032FA0365
MHLQRIRVPDFRVLKDVDITFENDFVPKIFPLGSLKNELNQMLFNKKINIDKDLNGVNFTLDRNGALVST